MTEDRDTGVPDLIDRAALRAVAVRESSGDYGLTLWRETFLALIDAAPAAEPVPLTLDLDTFIAGLDSPNHSDASRRDWCRLFFRDLQLAAPAAEPVPLTLDALTVKELARIIDEVGTARQDDVDWTKTRPKRPTELAQDILAALARPEPSAQEDPEPKPLWGEEGPAVGFAFTHESGVGMRWTGSHWEEVK